MNDNTKKARLKRYIVCEFVLGPYLGPERKHYILWYANLPESRVMTVVQLVRDPKRLGDTKRNPILYKNTLDARKFVPMDAHKWVLISGGHQMFRILEPQLRRITRPMARLCGGNDNDNTQWQDFEAGHATETLGIWREQVLQKLSNEFVICDHSETLAWLLPHYKDYYGDVVTEETHNEE